MPEFAALNAGGLSNNEISNTLPEELVDGNDSDITKNNGKIQVMDPGRHTPLKSLLPKAYRICLLCLSCKTMPKTNVCCAIMKLKRLQILCTSHHLSSIFSNPSSGL